MTMDADDLALAIAEGNAMMAAYRAERGLDPNEDHGLLDPVVSLLHTRHAATHQAPDAVVAEVLDAIDSFSHEVGVDIDNVNERLGCNLRGRLDAVERAAKSGDDAGARRELKALLKFFPQ